MQRLPRTARFKAAFHICEVEKITRPYKCVDNAYFHDRLSQDI